MSFLVVPPGKHYRLSNCTLLPAFSAVADRPKLVDIDIADGHIRRVAPAGASPPHEATVDCRRGMVWPTFKDVHTHIDKAHIWNRAPNRDGSWETALTSVATDRAARWSADDVYRRASFTLATAFAHGTSAMRTHIDTLAPQGAISWPAIARLRQEWMGRIELQMCSIGPVEMLMGPVGEATADLVAEHGGLLGCVLRSSADLARTLDVIFQLAKSRNLDLDFHVDETDDPTSVSLRAVADATLRHGYEGRVTCGHACSLALQEPAEAARTVTAVRSAGLSIVSLPMCNLYLQDRAPGRTPRWRGVTLLHELADAGIPVSLASDNVRDPFYAYGDCDMLEVLREGTRICHLETGATDWIHSVTDVPARTMGLPPSGIVAGQRADLIVFRARSMSELLSRHQSDRVVVRSGEQISTALPDYVLLDDIMLDVAGNG